MSEKSHTKGQIKHFMTYNQYLILTQNLKSNFINVNVVKRKSQLTPDVWKKKAIFAKNNIYQKSLKLTHVHFKCGQSQDSVT